MRPPYKEDRILRSFQGTKVCYVKNNPLKSRDFRELLWRRRWDSNPRYREVQLISSLLVSVSTSGRFVSVSGRFV